MTLRRQSTLTRPSDFSFVFSNAKKAYGQHLTILFRKSENGYPRLGLAISKKHSRTAIKRNLIRRIVKESFRASAADLGSVDIVVLSKRGIIDIDRKILRSSIDQQWKVVIKKCASSSSN